MKPGFKPRPIKKAPQHHPEKLRTQAKVRMPEDDMKEFVSSSILDVQKAITDRQTWELNLTRWFKKRYGIRPSVKNSPWPGASNTHVFLTEEKIRKLKPNYVNLAFEGEPLVTMYPVGATPQQVAQDSEIFMDWLLRFYMNRASGKNYFESMTMTVDQMLEQGLSVIKTVWEYQTRYFTKVVDLDDPDLPPQIKAMVNNPLATDDELFALMVAETQLSPDDEEDMAQLLDLLEQFRSGKRLLTFKLQEEVYNGPRCVYVPARHVIVPSDTTDLETARFVCHRMFVTLNDLKAAQRDGKYKNVEEVESKLAWQNRQPASTPSQSVSAEAQYSTLEIAKASREGVYQFLQRSELIEIWEEFLWYDLNQDGVDEKCVLTVHPSSGTILRFIEFPYDHGKWPFTVFPYELTDDRWYSPRGVSELMDHYQTIMTNQENAKLDRMTMANSLQFKYRINSVNNSQMRFIPGQGIGLQRMDDLEELQINNLDISFDNEMNKIRGLSESLIGQPDMAMQTSSSQPQERRTAFEVSETVALGQQMFSLDARVFKNSLQKMYEQIFALWMQYGPEEVWVAVTDGPPTKLTKDQIRGDLAIQPNGQFTMLSRTLEQQRAYSILQLAVSDKSGAIDQYNAWENYLLKVDPRASKRILVPREQYMQIQQLRMQQEQIKFAQEMALAGRGPKASSSDNGNKSSGGGNGMRPSGRLGNSTSPDIGAMNR